MSHLTLENRKLISNMITQRKICTDIAKTIGCDPTKIAKEVKKNRIISKEAKYKDKFLCKKLEKFSYVWVDCSHKYTYCILPQLRLNAEMARKKYDYRFHKTRKWINLTPEEHTLLNKALKDGLLEKKSVYSIIHSSNINTPLPSVYRYIREKKVNVSRIREVESKELPQDITESQIVEYYNRKL